MKCKKLIMLMLLIAVVGIHCYLSACGSQRRLVLSDFDFLEPCMSLSEIMERVGKPDRDVGSGFYIYQYDLVDGSVVTLQFGGDSRCLLAAVVTADDGITTNLLENSSFR